MSRLLEPRPDFCGCRPRVWYARPRRPRLSRSTGTPVRLTRSGRTRRIDRPTRPSGSDGPADRVHRLVARLGGADTKRTRLRPCARSGHSRLDGITLESGRTSVSQDLGRYPFQNGIFPVSMSLHITMSPQKL